MAKNLVIVESPAKAKTIGKILGKDYVVKSSVGHIRDLPVKSLGVDIDNDFAPKYVMVKGKKKIVDELRKAAASCDRILLAPDPDREGEAIAWHLRCLLDPGDDSKVFERVQYNEITPRAVRAAFDNPGTIDMDRVDAQQARRVLDRIVGYTVSPMLWRKLKRGLSAGRVQSVALRLVSEREREIEAFTPEEFWLLGAMARKLIVPLEPFKLKLARINDKKVEVKSGELAEQILTDVKERALKVLDVKSRTISKKPAAPFITSTLQQAGSSYHGFAPSRTMGLAQKLYEGIDSGQGPVGLITYMRTDSVNVSRDAQDACLKYIEGSYGKSFCPEKPNVYRSRGSAQEAHEAIRPTDVSCTPQSLTGRLDGPELKLYELIWRRFVASQMVPAKIEVRTARVDAVQPDDDATAYTFTASASEVVFPGYMKAGGKEATKSKEGKEGESDEIDRLPSLNPGEPLECIEWLSDRKETKPPPRFSEAALIRALESNGVGRPSTYASIIGTLHQRDYVTREKRTLSPTQLGLQVNDMLVGTLNQLFDVGFTASMEEQLDDVEQGKANWTEMLRGFYEQFSTWMEATKEPPADEQAVAGVLAALKSVGEWAPAVKRGRRTFSDEKFVISIGEQIEEKSRPVSNRQLETLMRMVARYKVQIPTAEAVLSGLDRVELLTAPELKPPRESTRRKLDIVKAVELGDESRDFLNSLDNQVTSGRRLSDAQLRALDNMVVSNAKQIENFETVKAELGIEAAAPGEDKESGVLIEALKGVSEWREPVKRGRRTYDDGEFFTSVSGHYRRKGFLSPRQRAALRKMVSRYREQIGDYDALSKQLTEMQEQAKDAETAGKDA